MTPIRSFVRFLWSTARWQLVLAIVFSAILSLAEGVSLAMVFPVITLLGDQSHVSFGSSSASLPAGPRTQMLFHLLANLHLPRSQWLIALLLVVLVSVGLLGQLNRMLIILTGGVILRVRRELAAQLFRAILHADWSYLTTRRSSDLTHYLTDEASRVSHVAAALIGAVSNCMVGVFLLGVAVYLAPVLTVFVVVSFGLLVPWQRRAGRAIYESGDAISEKMSEVFDSSTDRLQNLKVVKVYGAQDAELEMFVRRYAAVTGEMLANQRRSIVSSSRFQWFSMAILCGVILLGLGPLHLTAISLLIFLFALLRATPRLEAVQVRLNEIMADLPAYAQVQQLLGECEAHSEREEQGGAAPRLTHELTFESVSFAYRTGAAAVLDCVDLTLPAGRITAIAGISGAGKSTLADLVMGLLIPVDGRIAADGVAITRANARAWRRSVGYVSQDTLLFHDTVRENLLWAKPDATDSDLAEAIETASAQFLYGLPDGLDTIVGDRGIMLSHGQRQRVALARAFLLKPALLILDEATNSLDLENEARILETVGAQGGRVTTLLISHRPSAVQVADRVYVLAEGKIKLQGEASQGEAQEGQAGVRLSRM